MHFSLNILSKALLKHEKIAMLQMRCHSSPLVDEVQRKQGKTYLLLWVLN